CSPQDLVEQLWLWRLPFGQPEIRATDLIEDRAQLLELFRLRRIVNAVHAGLAACLEFLCSGDVRQDHELLDESMAVESVFARDRDGPSLGVADNPILVEIELECTALCSRLGERSECPKQRH